MMSFPWNLVLRVEGMSRTINRKKAERVFMGEIGSSTIWVNLLMNFGHDFFGRSGRSDG
jgi:hypothetical protein